MFDVVIFFSVEQPARSRKASGRKRSVLLAIISCYRVPPKSVELAHSSRMILLRVIEVNCQRVSHCSVADLGVYAVRGGVGQVGIKAAEGILS